MIKRIIFTPLLFIIAVIIAPLFPIIVVAQFWEIEILWAEQLPEKTILRLIDWFED